MRLSDEWNKKFGDMVMAIRSNKYEMIENDVNLVIILNIRRVTDTDAPLKGIFDALEESGVIKNDKQIRKFLVRATDEFIKETGEFAIIGVFSDDKGFPFSQAVVDFANDPLE